MKTLAIVLVTSALTVGMSAPLLAEDSGPSVLTPLTDEQKKAQEQGQALANKIMSGLPRFSIIGELSQDTSGAFYINGEPVKINSSTRIEGELTIGAIVSAHGFIENGVRTARVASVSSNPTVTKEAAVTEPGTVRLDLSENSQSKK